MSANQPEVVLACVPVGYFPPITIRIEFDKTVAELKQRIRDEYKYTFKFPAEELELYLSTREGPWMQSDDITFAPLMLLRSYDEVTLAMQYFTHMEPSSLIGDPAFRFQTDPESGDEDIHVLIQLPPGELEKLVVEREQEQAAGRGRVTMPVVFQRATELQEQDYDNEPEDTPTDWFSFVMHPMQWLSPALVSRPAAAKKDT